MADLNMTPKINAKVDIGSDTMLTPKISNKFLSMGLNSGFNTPRNSSLHKLEEWQLLFLQQQITRIKEKSEYRKAYPQLIKIIFSPNYKFEFLPRKLKIQVYQATIHCQTRICYRYLADQNFEKRTHSHKKVETLLTDGENLLQLWNSELEQEYVEQSYLNKAQNEQRSRSVSYNGSEPEDHLRNRNNSGFSDTSSLADQSMEYPEIDDLKPENNLQKYQGQILTHPQYMQYIQSQLSFFYCWLLFLKKQNNAQKMKSYELILYKALEYIKIFKDMIIKEFELQNIINMIHIEHANYIFENQKFKEAKILYDLVIEKLTHQLTYSMQSFENVKKAELKDKKRTYLDMSKSVHNLITVLLTYTELQGYLKNYNKYHETLKLIIFLQDKFKFELEDSDDLTGKVYELLDELEDKNNPFQMMQKSDAEIRKILGRVFGEEIIQKRIKWQEKVQTDQEIYDQKMYLKYGYQSLNDNLFIFSKDKNLQKNMKNSNTLEPNAGIHKRSKSKRYQRQSILLIESLQSHSLQNHLNISQNLNANNPPSATDIEHISTSKNGPSFFSPKNNFQSTQTPKHSIAQESQSLYQSQQQPSQQSQQQQKFKVQSPSRFLSQKSPSTNITNSQMNSIQETTEPPSHTQSQQPPQSQNFLIQSEYAIQQASVQNPPSTQRSPKKNQTQNTIPEEQPIQKDSKYNTNLNFTANFSTQASISKNGYNLNSKDSLVQNNQNNNNLNQTQQSQLFGTNNNTLNSTQQNATTSILTKGKYQNLGISHEKNHRSIMKKNEKPTIYTIPDSQLKKIYYKDSTVTLKDAKILTTDKYWLPPNQRTCYSQPFDNMTMLMKQPPKKQSQFYNEEAIKKNHNNSLDLDQHFKDIIEHKFNQPDDQNPHEPSQTLPFFHVKEGLDYIQQDEIFDNKEFNNGMKMIKFRKLYCQGERTTDTKKKTYLNQKLTQEEIMLQEPKTSKVNTFNEMQAETQFFESQFVCQEFLEERRIALQQQKKAQMNLLDDSSNPKNQKRATRNLKQKVLAHYSTLGINGLNQIKKQHKQEQQIQHYKDLKSGDLGTNAKRKSVSGNPTKILRNKQKTMDHMSIDEFNAVTKNTITQFVHQAEDRDVQIDKQTENLKKKTHFEEGYEMKTMPKKAQISTYSHRQFEYFKKTDNNEDANLLSKYVTKNRYHLREEGKRAQNFADIAQTLLKKNKMQQNINQKVTFSQSSVKTSKSVRLLNRLDSRLNC